MKIRSILVLTAILGASPVWAVAPANGPDLALSLAPPSNAHVYETRRYTYTISNVGNKPAAGVKLVVTLPRTGTSPEVYVMGIVNGYSTRCALAGATLTCQLESLNRNQSTSVFVDLTLPYSTAPIVLDALASTTTMIEQNPANNRVIHTASLLTYPGTMTFGVAIVNQHCTGNTSLSSFFECTLFPSSISEHETIFNADNTLSFVAAPASYTGTWTYTPAQNRLRFQYYDGLVQVAAFDGRGVGANCFEGITTFPASTPGYVAPYRLCFP